jgi:ketosteroid isomerase-like protein
VLRETLEAVLGTFVQGRVDGVAEHFAEAAVYREARKPAIVGRPAIAAQFARFAASGVPFRFTVDDVIASDARACIVYRFSTPGGDGEPWRERAGCATVHIDRRGQITEWREYEG